MITIWKYEIPASPEFTIDMPAGARVLAVHMQYGKPCMWVAVDTEAVVRPRRFALVGTGHPSSTDVVMNGKHIGTFLVEEYSLVWHVFDLGVSPVYTGQPS